MRFTDSMRQTPEKGKNKPTFYDMKKVRGQWVCPFDETIRFIQKMIEDDQHYAIERQRRKKQRNKILCVVFVLLCASSSILVKWMIEEHQRKVQSSLFWQGR